MAPGVLERFDREARAAAMLDHPNVCPIFDVGTIDGIPYASMAYIEGRPLADLVDIDKRLAERRVRRARPQGRGSRWPRPTSRGSSIAT